MDKRVYEIIKEHADHGDRESLKYIFVDALDVDPTFKRYEEGYNYCKQIPGLLEEHVELTPFLSDKSQWNDTYWTRLKRDLEKNFSDKRISHMREVAKVILSEKVDKIQAERTLQMSPSRKQESVPSSVRPTQSSISKEEEKNKQLEEDRRRVALEYEKQKKAQEEQRRQLEAKKRYYEEQSKKGKNEETLKKTKRIALIAALSVTAIVLVVILSKCNPLNLN